MSDAQRGVDYSAIHRIDSPANRLVREEIWPPGHDLGQQSFATLDYFDHLIRRLGLAEGVRVLDIGSGTGGPAIYLASHSGCHLTGVEINEVGVEVARTLAATSDLGDRIEFVQGDGMAMPFADESFDVVTSMNVMNVFADKVALLREVRRMLRPGGTLAFLSGTFEFGPDDGAARRMIEEGYAIPQYLDSLAGYKSKLLEAGFVIDEVTEYLSDFEGKVAQWLAAWQKHRDAIAAEQGAESTDHHIEYFKVYLALIRAGKAANHLIIAHRPE
ncbi:MAG TPA: methyltransferase domain-containing protein [Miltoncostaeaceae bacterium]|nr:methyltransferase domain-containing protein [Miltoncostaeaceae bacterium]